MKCLKVLTLVGTRPEIIKLSRVIPALDRHFDHVLVHSGQNFDYELNEIFFKELEIRKPDHFLDAVGKSAAQTISNVIAKTDEVLEREAPDAFLVYGDTNSCLAVIAAKRRKIPVFHMEAGNRCFDQRVPEELNRRVVDHLSDVNMTLTEHARRYLLSEGLRGETVFKTGSSMAEILSYYAPSIEASKILSKLKLQKKEFFIASFHREENVDDVENLQQILSSLEALADQYHFPVIVSTHPRTKKRMESLKRKLHKLVIFQKPLGFFDYMKLQTTAACVISDSGTLTEEASIQKFPAIMIRNAHERPEGMDEATVIMTGLNKQRILEAVKMTLAQFKDSQSPFSIVPDYNVNNVSEKVVRIIMSYTDYVNRTVWKK